MAGLTNPDRALSVITTPMTPNYSHNDLDISGWIHEIVGIITSGKQKSHWKRCFCFFSPKVLSFPELRADQYLNQCWVPSAIHEQLHSLLRARTDLIQRDQEEACFLFSWKFIALSLEKIKVGTDLFHKVLLFPLQMFLKVGVILLWNLNPGMCSRILPFTGNTVFHSWTVYWIRFLRDTEQALWKWLYMKWLLSGYLDLDLVRGWGFYLFPWQYSQL